MSESVKQMSSPLASAIPIFLAAPCPRFAHENIFTGYLFATSTVLSVLPLSTTTTSNSLLERLFEYSEERVWLIVFSLFRAAITTESKVTLRSSSRIEFSRRVDGIFESRK